MAITKQQLDDAERDATDLGSIVNGAVDLNGNGTVSTRTGGPVKTLNKAISEIENSGRFLAETWSALNAITNRLPGTTAEVPISDGGTHTDPVVGGTVANSGVYVWSASPAGWKRVQSVSAQDLATLGERTNNSKAVTPLNSLEYARETVSVKPPLAPSTPVNAVTQRYSLLAGTGASVSFGTSVDIPSYTYLKSVWDEARQPNVLRGAMTAGAVANSPQILLKITPAQLASIGVVPDDTTPPQISVKGGMRIDSAINQALTSGNGATGQMYVVLRYNGVGASLDGALDTANDVVFTNADAQVLPGYQGVGNALWTTNVGASNNVGELSFLTGKYKKYRRLGVKVPATLNGKALSGVIIRLYGRTPGAGASQLDFYDLALIAGTAVDWDKNYINPTDRHDDAARLSDLTTINNQLKLKAAYSPPLKPLSYRNAIPNRYSLDGSVSSKLPVAAATAYTYSNVWNADVFDTYGEPNVVEVGGTSAGAGLYQPEFNIVVTPADLARIGIVPDDANPPLISVRAAILLAGLVNENIDTVKDSGFGQVWVGLRYDGVGGSTAPGFQAARGDCVFSNSATGLNGTYYVPTPNPFAAVQGNLMSDTARFKGYTRTGIPVPATINGKALTHIAIKIYGRTVGSGAFKMSVGRLAVVAGATVDPLDSYIDYSDYPAASPATGGTQTNVLDIQRAQKVGAIGNSYTASHYTPRGKHWLAKLSALTDYNVENFAVSGDTNQTNLGRLRDGALTYGNRSWKDYGVTYAIVVNATNDPTYELWDEYLDDMRGMSETLRANGSIPILASEFTIGKFGGGYQRGIQAVAQEQNAHFLDLTPNALNYDNPTGARDTNLWGAGHPGVRTNELFSAPVVRFINSLPRPQESLKIFRKRTAVAVGSLDDLVTDSLYDRMRLFREIEIGHVCMTAATEKYMDELDTNSGSVIYETVNSEYLALQAGQAVAFADYGLVDVIVNGTDANIGTLALLISDPAVTVYARDLNAAPYENATRYQKFMVGSPTVSPGATYTSNDADIPEVFTVVGLAPGGRLITSPMASNRAPQGAGTLTKTGGSGDASIAYSSSMPGSHPDYYTNLGKPEGHFVAVAGDSLGRFSLNDLRGKLQGDRIQFLLYKSGGFSLTKCQIEYTGGGWKPRAPRPYFGPRAGTAELLTETKTGTSGQLAGWTVVGSLTPGRAVDDTGTLPYGTTGYVTVNSGNKLRQAFAFTPDYNQSRDAEIVVKARRWPGKVNSGTYPSGAGITQETVDMGLLRIGLDDGTLLASIRVPVGLWWTDAIVRMNVPAFANGLTLQIDTTGSDIQVAGASVKLV